MANIYQVQHHSINAVKEHPFQLEKEMQRVFEENLTLFTGLTLVRSEFPLKQFRFDTVAFDKDRQAFVIIEYKRDRSQSVVDQGVAYLNAMLEYRDSLIIEYNEQNPDTHLLRKDIDWSQSRVLFVANSFTDFQRNATNFKNLGIELVEFKRYDNGILTVNFLERSKNAPTLEASTFGESNGSYSGASIKAKVIPAIPKEIIEYDEEYLLQGKPDAICELFQKFKDAILNLDDSLELKFNKLYASFRKDRSSIVDIHLQKSALKLWINAIWGTLDDARNLFRDVSQLGHLGSGDYEVTITDTQDLEYILSVIKQKL